MNRTAQQLWKWRVGLACSSLMLVQVPATVDARDGGDEPSDRAEKAAERAARDSARAEERASRDAERFEQDRVKIVEERSDAADREAEELIKLEEDRAEQATKDQEDAAKDAQDLAEDIAKAEEDAAEDAAKEAEDAAEDAAKEAEDAAKDAAEDSPDDDNDYEEHGSSAEMRELATAEAPEFDQRGFPVRRGEIVALNLDDSGIAELERGGFSVISRQELPALDSHVVRLAVPKGMEAGRALDAARKAEPKATFDLTHYYGMQFSPSGAKGAAGKGDLPRKKGRLSIGMIDTGVASHPALAGTSIAFRDFGHGPQAVPTGHGTAVASILVSEGASKLHVANIFRGGTGTPYTSAEVIIDALDWMVANKVTVVNMSLAGPRNAILDSLIARSIARGTVIVAAAGNGGPTAPPAYPAALKPVIAVTAVDGQDRVYRYANRGAYISVAARGVNEPAANSKGGFGRFTGTSFATPHVAAWLARCQQSEPSAACAKKLRLKARDLGVPGFDPVYGYGVIE